MNEPQQAQLAQQSNNRTLHKHQHEMEKIDQQIVELINKRWALFLEDTNKEEIQTAFEMLTDDPLNTLSDIMEPDNACGRWFIPDEVLCTREMEVEEGEES